MLTRVTVGAAIAAIAIAFAWRELFATWTNSPGQFAMAESLLEPWWAFSWIGIGALVLATAIPMRVFWIPFAIVGFAAVCLQGFTAVTFGLSRPLDGSVSPLGAALASLSAVQLVVTLGWIGLIVRSKTVGT